MIAEKKVVVGLVGPCGAGKTTLKSGLETAGWSVRHIAQEHSYVADMWQRISHPDVLIFLEAGFATASRRRCLDWTEKEYTEQQHRLRHARRHADLVIQTDGLTAGEVLQQTLAFLEALEADRAG